MMLFFQLLSILSRCHIRMLLKIADKVLGISEIHPFRNFIYRQLLVGQKFLCFGYAGLGCTVAEGLLSAFF